MLVHRPGAAWIAREQQRRRHEISLALGRERFRGAFAADEHLGLLGEAVDAKPWMGARPCLPDMLPVIGKAPRHPGLWFDFGHQHHGLTLGPATGRLLAEMMTGEEPFADPKPFAAERFG